MPESEPPCILRPISRSESGEPIEPLRLDPEETYIIGRSSEADWSIHEPSVSRRHASLRFRTDQWMITDLESRFGTSVNGKRLEGNAPVPLQDGDEISLGSWRCRVHAGGSGSGTQTLFTEDIAPRERISAIDPSRMSGVAQRGLDALLNLSAQLDSAPSLSDVAIAVAEAVKTAIGCERVVVARPVSTDEVELLASTVSEVPRLSRSLMEEASKKGLVELQVSGQVGNQAQSIMELNIRTAICAPIISGGSPLAFLVVDTRDSERALPPDAAAFCQSVARLAGLAFERIGATTLTERNRQLQHDLDAARRVQELLSPAAAGEHGAVSYTFDCIPGRIVAGDLFDFFPLPDSRVAFFLGDVTGKGVGAAMVMAATQSQLRTQLLMGKELGAAITAASMDMFQRSDPSKFVTLVAGIIDAERGVLQTVDAGHGFWSLLSRSGSPSLIETPRGFPLGIVENADYEVGEHAFGVGDCLVLYSDGAVEQPCPAGHQFGLDAVHASLAVADTPQSAVRTLVTAVRDHARGDLADDLTVASIWCT